MARFTDEQLAAIEAKGKVIVSASAGSGKTTVMIEKIIRLIRSGVGVDEILAVTFTKKAASQMKEKLCKALIESINAEDTTEERRSALKKQLAGVPSADISTIHSFCSKLIKTHFFAAETDSNFRVIGGDDAEGTALKSEALDELLEEAYEAEERDEAFAHLLSVYWRKKSDKGLRKIFMGSYEDLRSRADYREYLLHSQEYTPQTFEEICQDLHGAFAEKCRYYQDLVENEKIYFEGVGAAAQTALATELCSWLEETLLVREYFEIPKIAKPKFTSNRRSKKDGEEKLLHIERLAFLRERILKAFKDEFGKLTTKDEELARFMRSAETGKALSKYLLLFDEKYEEKKRERGVLDYNDLEHKALKLLSDEEIVSEVREKYRYVFVDEYQDVNPVQEAIVSRLGGENLFLVGDVKQSIYGFRGSKSRFFVEKQKTFEAGEGTSLFMTKNFRSSDKVLNAVNTQFALAMTPLTCDVDYARGSFMARGGGYGEGSGRVEIHYLQDNEEEEKTTQVRGVYSVRQNAGRKAQEISVTAKRIKHIIQTELGRKYYDPETKEYREVRYADIAVLSRKKSGQIAETVAALSAEGLPVSSASAVNICEYAEIKTLIDILSLLDNAEQDVPLCSALLSAMGNLTADDLAEIRLAYKEDKALLFFRQACRKYAEEKQDFIADKLRNFYAYYEKIRALSRVLDAGELLSRVLAETRMEAQLLSLKNGAACLKRIHRFIEETANPEPLSVHGFLDRLRDLDYKIEYSENGGEDSVKVLTMHSSKGLEYPVVILDNLSAPFRGVDNDEVIIEEKYGLAPRAFDEKKMLKTNTLLRRLFAVKENRDCIADELNLYYVALTRAKYALHMIFDERGVMPDVKYAHSFAELTDFSVWKEYEVTDEILELSTQERTALVFRPDEELVQEIKQAFLWEYPHAGCENLRVKSSATQLISGSAYSVQKEENAPPFGAVKNTKETLFDGEEDFVQAGIAYHAFLEAFDFSLLYDERGNRLEKTAIAAAVDGALARGLEGAELLEKEKLVEILCNPVFGELRNMRLYKEQQFLVTLPVKQAYKNAAEILDLQKVGEDEQMIFQGAIDLLAVGDEVRIIDYKYSTRNAEYLRTHYKPQLALYRMAVAKALKIEECKIHCTIVNIRLGFEVEVE